MFLYSYATYLETLLVQNTDSEYLQNIAEEIKERESGFSESLDAWEKKFSGYIEKARAFRLDRFLEDQGTDHFWDKPVNRVKEAILLKRDDSPLEAARECFSSIVISQEDRTPIASVRQSIDMLDRVYNQPVEAIMAGNDLYIRLGEAV